MLAKRIKATLGKDKKLLLYLPEMPLGEVEVIVLGKEEQAISVDYMLGNIPKRKLGKVMGSLHREDIYDDAR